MYQKLIFVGRLTADPEMRYLPSGTAVTNFNLAVDDDYTNDQGVKVERAIFIRVSTFGKVAENVNQYMKKGSPVLIEGTLNGEWVTGADGKQTMNGPKVWTAKDGTPHASFEIRAFTVKFLPGGPAKGAAGTTPAASNVSSSADPNDQGIPF